MRSRRAATSRCLRCSMVFQLAAEVADALQSASRRSTSNCCSPGPRRPTPFSVARGASTSASAVGKAYSNCASSTGQAGLIRPRAAGKDVQNQLGTVDDLQIGGLFQVSAVCAGERSLSKIRSSRPRPHWPASPALRPCHYPNRWEATGRERRCTMCPTTRQPAASASPSQLIQRVGMSACDRSLQR